MGVGYNVALAIGAIAPSVHGPSFRPPRSFSDSGFFKNMTSILKLRGAPALSSSRQERLSRAVSEVLPKLAGLAAEHWYFVGVAAPLTADEIARLVDLLDRGVFSVGASACTAWRTACARALPQPSSTTLRAPSPGGA